VFANVNPSKSLFDRRTCGLRRRHVRRHKPHLIGRAQNPQSARNVAANLTAAHSGPARSQNSRTPPKPMNANSPRKSRIEERKLFCEFS
jgi:hypothetical protein